MNILKLLIVAAAFILFAFGTTALFYSTYIVKEKTTIPMFLQVQGRAGMSGDRDKLDFGITFPGGWSRKWIKVTNTYDHPVQVITALTGDMAAWTSLSDITFPIQPGEEKEITFEAHPPDTTPFGNYTGEAVVTLKRAFN